MNNDSKVLTIGILTETQNNEYPIDLMQGIIDACRNEKIALIRFMSLNPRDEQDIYINKDILSQVINSAGIDGLLFLGWIYDFLGQDTTLEFMKQFSNITLVSMGKGYTDIPHVTIDGNNAFKENLQHLIELHQRKNIAIIAPELYDSRLQIYEDVLKAHNIYKKEFFVSKEDLNGVYFGRGERAVAILLDERKLVPDVIISLDENNSIMIIENLKNRGFRVPEEIAVTSYEDGEGGKYSFPSLTTIPYSFYDLGYYSCKKMINILRKREFAFAETIETHIIYRRSCGCPSPLITHFFSRPGQQPGNVQFPLTQAQQEQAVQWIREDSGCPYAKEITAGFAHSLEKGDTGLFLEKILLEILTKIQSKKELQHLHKCISSLHKYFFPGSFMDREHIFAGEQLLHRCRLLLGEYMEMLVGKHFIADQRNMRILLKLYRELGNAFDLDMLIRLLLKDLPFLNIKSCYFSLFEGKDFTGGEYTLMLVYKDGTHLTRENMFTRYTTDKLLPQELLIREEGRVYFYQPLFFGQEFLGSVIFESGPWDLRVFRLLSEMLSSAIKGARLMKNLEIAYRDLQNAQMEIIKKAHQAGMSEIIISILHNIGNIQTSITTSVYILDNLLEQNPIDKLELANKLLEQKFSHLKTIAEDEQGAQQLLQYYCRLESLYSAKQKQMVEHVSRIRKHSELINKVIVQQQHFAVNKLELEKADLKALVETQLEYLYSVLSQSGIIVYRDFNEQLQFAIVHRTKFSYIFMSIINNAIESFADYPGRERKLRFLLNNSQRKVILKIADNGCGMESGTIRKLFQFGFSLKESGSGLSLHNCAVFMSEMQGKISAYSPGLGQGSVFTLEFKGVASST